MKNIALVITSILSIVFLSTTIIEHNKLTVLKTTCTASVINNLKSINKIIDSTKAPKDKNGEPLF